MVGISGGALLSSGAFVLLAGVDQQAFLAWGRRIPFLAGAVLIVVGFWVRRTITEPEAFRTAREIGTTVRLPLAQLLRTSWRTVLLATGVSIGYNAFVYLIFTFALAYSTTELHLPRQLVLNALMVGLALQIPTIVLAAILSDRVSRAGVMIAGGLFLAIDAFVFFRLLDTRNTVAVFLTIAVAYMGAAVMYGPLAAYFADAFDVSIRYSGISLSYQLGASLGGGLTPTILTLLVIATGTNVAVSLYIAALALIAVGCLIGLSRSRRSRRTEAGPEARERVAAPAAEV